MLKSDLPEITLAFNLEQQSEFNEVHTAYIAGPMSGRSLQNARAFFRVAVDLRALGVQTVNPAEHDLANGVSLDQDLPAADRPKVLREDLILMLRDCQAVVALPEWQKSQGARLELAVAAICGLPIYEVQASSVISLNEYIEKGVLEPGWRLLRMDNQETERLKEVFSYEFI